MLRARAALGGFRCCPPLCLALSVPRCLMGQCQERLPYWTQHPTPHRPALCPSGKSPTLSRHLETTLMTEHKMTSHHLSVPHRSLAPFPIHPLCPAPPPGGFLWGKLDMPLVFRRDMKLTMSSVKPEAARAGLRDSVCGWWFAEEVGVSGDRCSQSGLPGGGSRRSACS